MAKRSLFQFALVVRDYDEAIAWFTQKLGFELLEDTDMGGGKRWVVVAPSRDAGAQMLLARAVNDQQSSRIGNQAGGRVWLFMHTDDCRRDVRDWTARGVKFLEQPREEEYGIVVVFEDLYGNKWDLIQRRH